MQCPNTEPAVKVNRPHESQPVVTRRLESWLDRYFYLLLAVIVAIIICFCAAGIFIDRQTRSLLRLAFTPDFSTLSGQARP
jgi:hypothetical protein